MRWYSIPNLWRYERPQRGRLREHWQLNVDLFGVEDTSAELELITLVNDIFKNFGARPDMYAIKLNHRQLTDHILDQYLQLDGAQTNAASKLIDRMHKMERTAFISKLDEILTAEQREAGVSQRLMDVLTVSDVASLPDDVKNQPTAIELTGLLAQLQTAGINNVSYDPTLMRGFDYYTGVVFEVYDTHPDNNRSMMGGGRYDGLVGLFGVPPVPTVGFGWGDVTLANFLELHHLLPGLPPETRVYVVLASVEAGAVAMTIAALRDAGVNVAVDLSGRKLSAQLSTANKKGIPFALVVGENELREQRYNLKDLHSGQEEMLTIQEIVAKVHDSH